MNDTECVRFLQWALPKLGLRWKGFRKVRRQVGKRIDRRMRDLGLDGIGSYRLYLESHPTEWECLDSFTRITISRFYRDRHVFDFLKLETLPALARLAFSRGDPELRCWSAGCASGEEPYSIKILWNLDARPYSAELPICITATDIDEYLLQRACEACYPQSSLKDVPGPWLSGAFDRGLDGFSVKQSFRKGIEFILQDIRKETADGPFHLILCRNLVFTYFDESLQNEVLTRILSVLAPEGRLVLGTHESVPPGCKDVRPQDCNSSTYLKL